ncbi:hypothetical protein [Legionella hackeliae]|uniref:Putative FAD-dependent pyridine nucleotide-disulphide oxidoreductase n=1 Tax=Legionella hackeliae TaxID=449 RepID=A0A0A8ULD2_LEGHA|nr:hypothetical protein [Legionella hackeliae]KTD10156.1 hypothetical protein Lhac_2524 [Legionella hackeliae]CEK09650.1 putative FAD-dependent pyridine nucleotide-disulphide oxidoreductase [Legionella hackeliae]STX49561.1 Uncharacterized protein conserved in bacteria [Legionella hackeliae]
MLQQSVIDVAVVGAGAAGLSAIASLIEEAKNNPSVELRIHVIEKRKEFTRRQKLIIPKDEVLPAQELKWDTFCRELFDPKNELRVNEAGELVDRNKKPIVNLNKRQKLLRKLLRQTDDLPSPKNFSIKSLQEALKEHIDSQTLTNIKLNWPPETKANAVDLNKKTIVLDNNEVINFDYLLLCEGEQRELTQQINKTINTDFTSSMTPFSYKKMGVPTYNMAARLTVKPLEKGQSYHDFLAKHRKKIDLRLKDLQPYGWSIEEGDPDFIFDDNLYKERFKDPNWTPRLFVASRIPELLHTSSTSIKRRKTLEWASLFAAVRVQIPAENFVIDEKGESEKQANVGTFISDIKYVDDPVRRLPNGGYIILLGDCAMSPYYPAGFSSAIAMCEARIAAACIVHSHQKTNQFMALVAKYHIYEKYIAEYVGYRNEDIEMLVDYIQGVRADLQKALATMPVSTKHEIHAALDKQSRINLLTQLCHLLTATSNKSNTLAQVKTALDHLSLTEIAYFEAIKCEPSIKELFETLENGQLLQELKQKGSSLGVKL